ncbi:MAG: hypothetical protein AB1578_02185 [Thermodesulfobacteriota bacterium]
MTALEGRLYDLALGGSRALNPTQGALALALGQPADLDAAGEDDPDGVRERLRRARAGERVVGEALRIARERWGEARAAADLERWRREVEPEHRRAVEALGKALLAVAAPRVSTSSSDSLPPPVNAYTWVPPP